MTQEAPNEALKDLAALVGSEATKEIVLLFLHDFPNAIRSLAKGGRNDQIRISHGLRNSALHMGADSLSRAMGAIEDRLATPGGEIAPGELDKAMADFEAYAADLRRYAAA